MSELETITFTEEQFACCLLHLLDDAVVLFDDTETLVFRNAAADELFGPVPDDSGPPPTATEWFQSHADNNFYRIAADKTAVDFVAGLLALFRQASCQRDVATEDGRWLRMRCLSDASRATRVSWTDITDLKVQLHPSAEKPREHWSWQTLFGRAMQGMALLSNDGFFLRANASFCDLVGYPVGELIEQPLAQMIEPCDLHALKLANARLRSGTVNAQRAPLALRHCNGDTVWVDAQLELARVDDADTLLLQVQDTSARRNAERACVIERERNHAIVNCLSEAVIATDPNGIIQAMNPVAERLTGWPLNEAGGKHLSHVYRIVEKGSRDPIVDPVSRCFGDVRLIGPPRDTVLLNRLGKELLVEDAVAPVRAPDGRLVGAALVIRDVTALLEAFQQRDQTSKLALIGQMASGIAHELNQPLTIISMAAEFSLTNLHSGRFESNALLGKLQTIDQQGRRMAEIIDHMRHFSRSEDGRQKQFDPAQAANDAIGLFRRPLRSLGIELNTELEGCRVSVCGHALRLEQVVLNLLTNARDAIQERMQRNSTALQQGEYTPRIRVSARVDMDHVTVAIRDNGGGIPDNVIGRIFDPFVTTKSAGKGTGLGLSISHSLIENMGGRLSVLNSGDGACFEIKLPILEKSRAPLIAPARRPDEKDVAIPCNRRRVLVVGDEGLVADSLTEYLVEMGNQVDTAADGRQALQLFKSERFDAVITDWHMPSMDGNMLIAQLRKSDPEIPVIVITGHTSAFDDNCGVVDGSVTVLQKPIRFHELIDRLDAVPQRQHSAA